MSDQPIPIEIRGDQPGQDQPREAYQSRTVKLECGGILTLSASFNLFALRHAEWQLINDLVKLLEAYEEGSTEV